MSYKIVGYGQTYAIDKTPHGYENVQVKVKPEFDDYDQATAFCEQMQLTAPYGLVFFVEGYGEVPECPTCGNDQWTRVRRIREDAHLTVLGSWEVYDDDFISEDKYHCYNCELVPTGELLQQLQEVK